MKVQVRNYLPAVAADIEHKLIAALPYSILFRHLLCSIDHCANEAFASNTKMVYGRNMVFGNNKHVYGRFWQNIFKNHNLVVLEQNFLLQGLIYNVAKYTVIHTTELQIYCTTDDYKIHLIMLILIVFLNYYCLKFFLDGSFDHENLPNA